MAPSSQRPQCHYPGCTRPAKPAEDRGAPPKYCYLDGHTPERAYRERRRLEAAAGRLDLASDPALLLAEITALRRSVTGLQAELDVHRHHHHDHHPDCPGPDSPGPDSPGPDSPGPDSPGPGRPGAS